MIKNYSISAKLKIIIIAVSGMTLLLACTVFILFDRYSYQQKLVQDLEIMARMMGANCTAALIFQNRSDVEETLLALREDKYIQAAFCV